MKTLLGTVFVVIIISCTDKRDNLEKSPYGYRDSLNGNYAEIIKQGGIPIYIDYYKNFKLVTKEFYKDGFLYDRESYDDNGNVVSHDPILIFDNYQQFKNTDTLIFKIKNVDSIKYYLYYYTVDKNEFYTDGDRKLKKRKPILFNESPLIKVSINDLNGQDSIYFKWGYLKSSKDSLSYRVDQWRLFNRIIGLIQK